MAAKYVTGFLCRIPNIYWRVQVESGNLPEFPSEIHRTMKNIWRVISEKGVFNSVINGKRVMNLESMINPLFSYMTKIINDFSVYNLEKWFSRCFKS